VEQSRANFLKNQGRAEQTFLNQNFKSRADPKLTKLYFEIAFIGRFRYENYRGMPKIAESFVSKMEVPFKISKHEFFRFIYVKK
jgi:hypothetical protein